jgi:imidazolonepropionase-like amidohydrolase
MLPRWRAWYTPPNFQEINEMKGLLGLALSLFAGSPVGGQTIAIRAGNLIDPAKGSIRKNQIVLVQNGKITAVGGSLAIPQDAQVIDLPREWVMPGLIDAHTHVTLNEIPGKSAI